MVGNILDKKSGLMYLCGHPGTGKTSCLNIILGKMQKANNEKKLPDFELFMYNAMAFTDVKSFALTLLQDVTQKKLGEETGRIERSKFDNEELSIKVAKALSIGNDRKSKSLQKYKVRAKHNIIVIDEVDQFNSYEKALTLLVSAIMRNEQFQHTNTSIIGIANTVDLPFKKKHSAIAMRDCQLLFEPYSIDQIEDILQMKRNSIYQRLPKYIKESDEYRTMFHNIVDEKAELIIAKKVAKKNGDIRVAFDIMKSALAFLQRTIEDHPTCPDKDKLSVTYKTVLDVSEEKYGSKVAKTIKSLTR